MINTYFILPRYCKKKKNQIINKIVRASYKKKVRKNIRITDQ